MFQSQLSQQPFLVLAITLYLLTSLYQDGGTMYNATARRLFHEQLCEAAVGQE